MGKIKTTKTVCHHSSDTTRARGATTSSWQTTQDSFWPEMRRGQGNSETKQLSLQAWNVMGSWWQHKIPIWMQYTNRSEYLVRWLLSPERHSKVYHSDSLWNWNYSGQHAFKFPYSSRQKEPHESAAKFWYLWKITSSPYKILFQEKIKISMGKHRSGNTLQYKSEKKIPNCRTDTSTWRRSCAGLGPGEQVEEAGKMSR